MLQDADAQLGLAGHERAFHRRRSAPARHQGRVDDDRLDGIQDALRHDLAIGADDEDVRGANPGASSDCGVGQAFGLQHRYAESIGELLDVRRPRRAVPAARAVWIGDERRGRRPRLREPLENELGEGRGARVREPQAGQRPPPTGLR